MSAYKFLTERFPDCHPLGRAVAIINCLGYKLYKYLPYRMEEVMLSDDPKPKESTRLQIEWKNNDPVRITRFTEVGVIVPSFGGEEALIPFSFIKRIEILK